MEEAIKALEAYGYTLEGERYVNKGKATPTQQWQATEGGFLRFDPPNDQPIPFKVKGAEEMPLGATGHGLSFSDPAHHDIFEWVWPAEEVARTYAHAAEQKAADWPDRNALENEGAPAPAEA